MADVDTRANVAIYTNICIGSYVNRFAENLHRRIAIVMGGSTEMRIGIQQCTSTNFDVGKTIDDDSIANDNIPVESKIPWEFDYSRGRYTDSRINLGAKKA